MRFPRISEHGASHSGLEVSIWHARHRRFAQFVASTLHRGMAAYEAAAATHERIVVPLVSQRGGDSPS
eukprot:3412535-Pyramimonas_sp.AAC.1